MIKITRVFIENPYQLICEFNNKEVRLLDALPILEQHKHLNGVYSLFEEEVFAKVEIGDFGELTWRQIVTSDYNGVTTCWDYDISPEFAYINSKQISLNKIA